MYYKIKSNILKVIYIQEKGWRYFKKVKLIQQ